MIRSVQQALVADYLRAKDGILADLDGLDEHDTTGRVDVRFLSR
ncbi:MAG TPA: hypothetical protein VE911_05155 [Candidatus Nitrosopolaris sp.]|nr:hypothetical protein [Candidatus Nitrosopolaris sp.]